MPPRRHRTANAVHPGGFLSRRVYLLIGMSRRVPEILLLGIVIICFFPCTYTHKRTFQMVVCIYARACVFAVIGTRRVRWNEGSPYLSSISRERVLEGVIVRNEKNNNNKYTHTAYTHIHI